MDEIELVGYGQRTGPAFIRWMFELIDDLDKCREQQCRCAEFDWPWQRGCVTTDLPPALVWSGGAR